MKGIVSIVAIAVIALLGTMTATAYDVILGDDTHPEDPLYTVEQIGESVRLALGDTSHIALVDERITEIEHLEAVDPGLLAIIRLEGEIKERMLEVKELRNGEEAMYRRAIQHMESRTIFAGDMDRVKKDCLDVCKGCFDICA